MTTPVKALDLTQRPPRSPRVCLGGIAILPRMIDKGRALLAGTIGDYHYDCPLDNIVKSFLDFDADALKEQLAAGKGDGEILEWLLANSKNKPSPVAIAGWTDHVNRFVPGDLGMRGFLQDTHGKIAPNRTDIVSLFDLLDLDDHVSYGGQA